MKNWRKHDAVTYSNNKKFILFVLLRKNFSASFLEESRNFQFYIVAFADDWL